MTKFRVYRKGLETFKNKNKFRKWLLKSNPALGRKAPSELLNDSMGMLTVIELLIKINERSKPKGKVIL